jgi:hypothetical protein
MEINVTIAVRSIRSGGSYPRCFLQCREPCFESVTGESFGNFLISQVSCIPFTFTINELV